MNKNILCGALLASSLVFIACGNSDSTASASGTSCFSVQQTANPCDAIDQDDFATWKFIRKDSFGSAMQYVYTVEGNKLVVTTTDSKCSVKRDDSSYSFYNMEHESSVFMAYNAVLGTCRDGQ